MENIIEEIQTMTSDTKQTHVKVTMPKDLYSRLVTESLNVLGEENLSQIIRTILRKHLK